MSITLFSRNHLVILNGIRSLICHPFVPSRIKAYQADQSSFKHLGLLSST